LVLPLGLIFATGISIFFPFHFLLHVVFLFTNMAFVHFIAEFFFIMTKITPEVGGISAHQPIRLERRQHKGEI